MTKGQHKVFSSKNSAVRSIAIGVLTTITLSILLSALLTSLILKGNTTEERADAIIFIVRIVSVFAGSLIATAIQKEKYLYTISLVALIYFVILTGINITSFEGNFKNLLSGIGSILLGALMVWLIRVKNKKRGRGIKKYAH